MVEVEVMDLQIEQANLEDLVEAEVLEVVAQDLEILLALVLHKVTLEVTLQRIELAVVAELVVEAELMVDLQVLQILMDQVQLELAVVAGVVDLEVEVVQAEVVELHLEHLLPNQAVPLMLHLIQVAVVAVEE